MIDDYDPQADSAEMMGLFGQTIRKTPQMPTKEERLLRARLMFEEGGVEMIKASGCKLVYHTGPYPEEPPIELNLDRLSVELDENAEPDLVAVADSIGDTLVVTYGAANCYGVDAEQVYDEVHRSNLSKVWPDGAIHKRADGKVIKPETYSPADLKTVLRRQGATL